MYKCKFKAYEGSEKYIFISYAHKDSEEVYPILDELAKRGYRVWYDDGIIPGSEWPEYIAKHLNDCEIVMYFVSPDSASSENCRREVNFALSRQKKFVSIFLKDTELSPGMELQIATTQSLFKQKYDTNEQFYERLFCTPMLEICKERIVEEAPAVTVPVSKETTAQSETMNLETTSEPVREPEPTYVSNERPDDVNPDFYEDEDTVPGKKKKSKKGAIFAASAAVIVVIAVVAVLLLGGLAGLLIYLNSDVKISEYYSFERDDEYVSLSYIEVTPEIINKLGRLKKMRNLSLYNCSFSGGANIADLKQIGKIEGILLDGCVGVGDYSFISEATSLESLEIKDTTDFTKLPPIGSNALRDVDFSNTAVTDVTGLGSLPSLQSVKCNNCMGLVLPGSFAGPIDEIWVPNCGISDLSCLSDQEYLWRVNINDNPISDISFMANSVDNVYKFYAENTNINDLELIASMESLTELDLSGIPMNDLSVIEDMDKLTKLYLNGCGLTSTDGGDLEKKRKLDKIDFGNNNLTEVPVINSEIDMISSFNIANNNITDLSKLTDDEMTWFVCYGNDIDWSADNNRNLLQRKITYVVTDYSKDYLTETPWEKLVDLYLVNAEHADGIYAQTALEGYNIDVMAIDENSMIEIMNSDWAYGMNLY